MTSMKHTSNLHILTVLLSIILLIRAQLQESDRVIEYNARNHSWPPLLHEYTPSSEGWQRIMARRLEQISHIDDRESRYSAYIIHLYVALLSSNFTEVGYELVRAPSHIFQELKALFNTLDNRKGQDFDILCNS